jgi:hypothetical protein
LLSKDVEADRPSLRSWVRAHAQDYILEYFRLQTERRKQAHAQHLERITAHAYHYYHAPPHPNEIASAQAQLKRGIDEDWQASVQRYPEVLEYFFGQVDITLPPDDDPAVKDPPLSALNGSRKAAGRRSSAGLGGGASGPSSYGYDTLPPRRTPPPPEFGGREREKGRRTPSFSARRTSFRPPPPPPPPSGYY